MKKLSILEIGETNNFNDVKIIMETIDLAKMADKLGYTRYWLGEHHQGEIAWHGPEILIAIISGLTKTIRIGSGGVLLPLNSPLRVAQNYKMLATLFPGRIDLGLARGSATQFIASELLNADILTSNITNHTKRITKTISYLSNEISVLNENQNIVVAPLKGSSPEVWILGSSGNTMNQAIEEKINYSFSLIHSTKNPQQEEGDEFKNFKHNYTKSNSLAPKCSIAIGVACGRTNKETSDLISNHKNNFLKINISGDKIKCYDEINALFEKFDINEILIHFFSSSFQNKRYCYETFSELFNLKTVVLP
jgi:luciferase family oxidoreductase group 1